MDINDYGIKQDIIDSLERYVVHGIEPGGFLVAVLANDLMESFGRADFINQHSLFDICSYVYNELPANSHGSYEIVSEWIKKIRERETGK